MRSRIGFVLFAAAMGGVTANSVSAQPSSIAGSAPVASESLPAPKTFVACAPDDPVATAERRIAPSIGLEFARCFRSPRSDGFALVHRMVGDGFTSADVNDLKKAVAAQWKDFQPLSAEFHDKYIARLNEMIVGNGSSSRPLVSEKPTLVSIRSLDAKSYSVVSIRSYVFNVGKGQEKAERINADAIVLRGQRMMRLTMQRRLTKAADVDEIQADIARWAKAME